MIFVFGHLQPDTDAYCSAVAYAQYLTQKGQEAQAVALGKPNKETQFVFSRADVDLPQIVDVLPSGSAIVLVDHNEAVQSIAHRENYAITAVIDHHKIADFSTSSPIFMRIEPVGCTCTVLCKLFQEQGFVPSPSVAHLMVSAIISDTLYFRSPTTTADDKEACAYLVSLTDMNDLEAYSLEMFSAKSDLSHLSPMEILMIDYKEFTFGDVRIGIGAMETTNPSFAFSRKDALIDAMREKKHTGGVDYLLFCVVDIFEEQNTALVCDAEDAELVSRVFGVSFQEGRASLGHLLSRKKQLVPAFEQYFNS